jgi:hypothetical protein
MREYPDASVGINDQEILAKIKHKFLIDVLHRPNCIITGILANSREKFGC